MTSQAATIIRCADLARHVYSTVESVERQTLSGGEIALVTDESTPAGALKWLTAFAKAKGLVLAKASGKEPGAARNAGIRATKAPFVMCLDAGELLDRRFHECAQAELEKDAAVEVVTSWVDLAGPGSEVRTSAQKSADLKSLIGNTAAIHDASVFRRKTWSAVEGFDEKLTALETYDFWLRVLGTDGRKCALIETPLLVRPLREDSLYRRSWAAENHAGGTRRVAEKHAALFAQDPGAALEARELVLRAIGDDYKRLLSRRDAGVRDLESLKAKAASLQASAGDAAPEATDLGDLNRTTPISREWGYERGRPIDRHYIERFLEGHSSDIRGAVLEVQEPDYTQRFGGKRVTRGDVVDLDSTNSRATIIGDLRSAANIASNTYDCVILTQTLHVIDDMRAVVSECARVLKPKGVLLATMPSASRVCLEYGYGGDCWRVTEAGARRLFSEVFPFHLLEVTSYGNVLVNAAFLYGLACHELGEPAFEATDAYFPLLVGVRARKGSSM